MSGTSLTAGEVMDRSAALLNDPAKTDYTYLAQMPYLNMAVDELFESLEESNVNISNQTSAIIIVPVGITKIVPLEWSASNPGCPLLPPDLVEIQEVGERAQGSNDPFIRMTKKEFITAFPTSSAFLIWSFEDQVINFNPNGANNPREIQLRYISDYGIVIVDSVNLIYVNNARSFLSFKTASLCSRYIGENETRADALEGDAQKALERLLGIANKGNQQIMTRHRPFRASYKARGGF